MLIVTLLTPIVQPIVQHSAQRVQARLQQNQPQYVQPSPQPQFVYHEGRWWKFENNQWYVEVK
jgi:hypothetical protein